MIPATTNRPNQSPPHDHTRPPHRRPHRPHLPPPPRPPMATPEAPPPDPPGQRRLPRQAPPRIPPPPARPTELAQPQRPLELRHPTERRRAAGRLARPDPRPLSRRVRTLGRHEDGRPRQPPLVLPRLRRPRRMEGP